MSFETFDAYGKASDEVRTILSAAGVDTDLRGDTFFWMGRKKQSKILRFSPYLYVLDDKTFIDTHAREHQPIRLETSGIDLS